MNFRFSSLRTIIKEEAETDFKKYVCFREPLENYTDNKTFILKIYKGKSYCRQGIINHYCPFDKNQIQKWLKYINKYLCKYTYKLSEDKTAYYIKVHVPGRRFLCLYVLTCIRYLYEFPGSMELHEAFKLKGVSGFRNYSMVNLINLVHRTMFRLWDNHNFGTCKYISLSQLKKNITTIKSINGAFNYDGEYPNYIKFDVDMNTTFHTGFWIDDNETNFKTRIDFYNKHKKEFFK